MTMRASLCCALTLIPLVACTPSAGPGPQSGEAAPAAPPAASAPAAPAAPAELPLYLEALTATSGSGVEGVVAGQGQGWRPDGDPADEGLLLRFDGPTPLTAVRVTRCGDGQPDLTLYLDGSRVEAAAAQDGPRLTLTPDRPDGAPALSVRSIFLKLGAAKSACLSRVEILGAGGSPLPLAAPRTADGTVVASSVLAPADAYHPGYLFDQRTDFGWVEGVDGTGAGQTLTLRLTSPRRITGIQLWNGYQRSADHFKKNARVKTLEVSAPGAEAQILAVADAMGAQILSLPTPITTQELTLTIKEAVAGTRFPDLVISELRLVDEGGPFTLDTPDMVERQTALSHALRSTPMAQVVDTRWAPVCTSDEANYTSTEGSLKLRTNHSFVFYEQVQSELDDATSTEVFDGAWVIAKGGSPWADLKLYGRRHRISATWSPYNGTDTTESTRVSGGAIRVARVADLHEDGLANLLKGWQKQGVGQAVLACERFLPTGAAFAQAYQELVDRGAIVVEGQAILGIYGRPPT